MNNHGYEKAYLVQVDKITNTEYSTDRSSHKTELDFKQVVDIKQEYVKKQEINTQKNIGESIKFYPFSNTISVRYEYTTPFGDGGQIVKGLNEAGVEAGENRLKSVKSDNKALLNSIFNLFKKK